MNKSVKEWVIIGISIILAVSTFALFIQKGALKTKLKEHQEGMDSMLTTQYELKRQIEETDKRSTDQEELTASLQKKLDEANFTIQALRGDKEDLLEEIESLKRKLTNASIAPEVQY